MAAIRFLHRGELREQRAFPVLLAGLPVSLTRSFIATRLSAVNSLGLLAL